MQEILIALGSIFGAFLFIVLVLVVTAIVLIKIYWPKVTRFFNEQAKAFTQAQEEAPKFARDTILLALETWDADSFLQRATPQLLATIPGGDLAIVFDAWKASLGDLISCTELVVKEEFSAGQAPFHNGNQNGGSMWNIAGIAIATYSSQLQGQNGEGEVEIQVLKRGDFWFVNTFNLQTPSTLLTLGQPTTLEALRERMMQEQKLEQTIEVPAIEP